MFPIKLSRMAAFMVLIGIIIVLTGCKEAEQNTNGQLGEVGNEKGQSEVRGMPSTEPSPSQMTINKEITLSVLTPLFNIQQTTDLHKEGVETYVRPGVQFTVTGLEGELAIVQNYNLGELRMPVWYAGEEAQDIKPMWPESLTLKEEAAMHLFPNSEWSLEMSDYSLASLAKLAGVKELKGAREIVYYSMQKWDDWYGVSLPFYSISDHSGVIKPLLLWVHESHVTRAEALPSGIWDEAAGVSMISIPLITAFALLEGTEQAAVERLLGQPSHVETSRVLSMTGEPMRLGTDWRYESQQAHFIVTFDENGQLLYSKWLLPVTLEAALTPNRIFWDEVNGYENRPLGLYPTIDAEWVWRNEGTLGFTYLEMANEDVLLIRGDDGGFSGMHYDGSLYAVDRTTGETLWQIDGGYGALNVVVDRDKKHVTVFREFDKESGTYRNQVLRIRLSDGSILWSSEEPDSAQLISMIGAGGVIAIYKEPTAELDGSLTGIQASSGKVLWTLTYEKGQSTHNLFNISGDEPYLLLQQTGKLYAIEPLSGKTKWEVSSRTGVSDQEYAYWKYEPRTSPFEPGGAGRWFQLGSELLYIELATGKQLSSYNLQEKERIMNLDNRYFLVNVALDAEVYHQGKKFETVLIDALSKKQLWRMEGGASQGVVDGEALYLVHEGAYMAVALETGELLWQTSYLHDPLEHNLYPSLQSADPLLSAYGEDLLLLDKNNGSILGRLSDVKISYHESSYISIKNGTINKEGNRVYLGSSNGYFSVLELKGE